MQKWAHLRDRAKERRIAQADLLALGDWKAQDSDVPDVDRTSVRSGFAAGAESECLSDGGTSNAREREPIKESR